MDSAESGIESVVHCLHFSSVNHALQFLHAETTDVVVHIIEALTAYALEHEVAIVPHFHAETVATKGAVFPFLSMVLHPEINVLEAAQVGLVKVFPLSFFTLFCGVFFLLANDGSRQLQRQCLQCAEHEIEVEHREENNVDGEQGQIVDDGNVGIEDHRESHGDAVAQQVAWHVGMTRHAPWQQEDVHDVIDAQCQGNESQQNVAAQDVFYQFLCRIDIYDVTAY